MDSRKPAREPELTALLISPDRELAARFTATIAETRAFQILAELKSYPANQTLDIRLRQLKPDVVLLDLASNLDAGVELIPFIASLRPPIHVIGLHWKNDSEAILRSLRVGASEFMHAPFEVQTQAEAIARIRRLRQPEAASQPELGRVIAFSSAKPGSGASTLATQTAFAIRKVTCKRVLLADFDLMGGTIGFYLKLNHNYSLLDALERSDRMDPALWSSLTANCDGVDILPAPEAPESDVVEPSRLHDVLEYARLLYDWVILDLPAIFQRISLLTMSEADRCFLVSTSELPSLHLARKAVALLTQLGFDKDRFQVVINRVSKRDGIGESDMEKIFNCRVHATFPNDYFSLHRVVTLGRPLAADCELGKAIELLAGRLSGAAAVEARRAGRLAEPKPALSES